MKEEQKEDKREKRLMYMREYYKKNAEYFKNYREAHKEKKSEYNAGHYKKYTKKIKGRKNNDIAKCIVQ